MSMQIPATCVHIDGTEHPAPSDLEWDPAQQRWVRMYRTCDWNRHESPDEAVTKVRTA